MPKEKGNRRGGGWEEQRSSSSKGISHKIFNPQENHELEQATIEKYLRMNKESGANLSMILYRMNAWKEKRLEPEVQENVDFDNGETWTYPEDEILDKYSGRMDFYVDNKNKHFSYDPMQRLMLACGQEKVSNADVHCRITGPDYAADHIWVTGYEIFVNGKKLPKGERCSLMDGDVIALGALHDSSQHWGDNKGKRGFGFKVKNIRLGGGQEQTNQNEEVNANDEDEDSSPAPSEALNNDVILGELMKYLSYKELKTARLVEKTWKGTVDPQIFSRTLVTFMDPNNFSIFDNRTYFPFTLSMIEKYYLPNWKMNMNIGYEEEYLIDKFMRVIKERGDMIRHLKLTLPYGSGHHVERFIQILRNLPRLETLQLTVPFLANPIPIVTSPINSITHIFPSVRHLCVGGSWPGNISVFMRQVAPLFPNIRKISTTGYIEEVLELILELNLWSKGLSEICSEGVGMGWSCTTNQLNCFKIIQALPNKLKKLQLLHIFPFESSLEIKIFEKMLGEHAETLEHLVLSFQSKRYSEESRTESLILSLPTFPKLKTLAFVSENEEDFPFEIRLPTSGSIRYESDFPLISRLRLFGNRYPNYAFHNFNGKAILDIFIPKDSDTVCPTMTHLEFNLDENNQRNGDEWYNEFVDRFQRMFPHVNYPKFN